MAVALEFIDFIVRIDAIESRYPGGLEACLYDHLPALNGRVWFDQHLFRDGAMNPLDIRSLAEHWEALGFVGLVTSAEGAHWQDFCVVERLFGGTTRRCDWLVVADRQAYFKGSPPGELMGRGSHDKDVARLQAGREAYLMNRRQRRRRSDP
jgi:hypothetical protein